MKQQYYCAKNSQVKYFWYKFNILGLFLNFHRELALTLHLDLTYSRNLYQERCKSYVQINYN